MCGDATAQPIAIFFGALGDLIDTISRTKFHINQLRGIRLADGQIGGSTIGKRDGFFLNWQALPRFSVNYVKNLFSSNSELGTTKL